MTTRVETSTPWKLSAQDRENYERVFSSVLISYAAIRIEREIGQGETHAVLLVSNNIIETPKVLKIIFLHVLPMPKLSYHASIPSLESLGNDYRFLNQCLYHAGAFGIVYAGKMRKSGAVTPTSRDIAIKTIKSKY